MKKFILLTAVFSLFTLIPEGSVPVAILEALIPAELLICASVIEPLLIIEAVIVPLSPVVITVPLIFGKLIVLFAVALTALTFVLKKPPCPFEAP